MFFVKYRIGALLFLLVGCAGSPKVDNIEEKWLSSQMEGSTLVVKDLPVEVLTFDSQLPPSNQDHFLMPSIRVNGFWEEELGSSVFPYQLGKRKIPTIKINTPANTSILPIEDADLLQISGSRKCKIQQTQKDDGVQVAKVYWRVSTEERTPVYYALPWHTQGSVLYELVYANVTGTYQALLDCDGVKTPVNLAFSAGWNTLSIQSQKPVDGQKQPDLYQTVAGFKFPEQILLRYVIVKM